MVSYNKFVSTGYKHIFNDNNVALGIILPIDVTQLIIIIVINEVILIN